jgi:hypothetical protein
MQVLCDRVKRFSMLGFAALLTASAMGSGQVEARPQTPAEARRYPYDGQLPDCGDPDVISRIQSRFSQSENEYWHSGLEILGFDRIDEIGYRSNGTDYIPRRYCVAEAVMNDQKLRTVSYSIGKDLGIIGWFGFGVEWCVAGLDREKAFAPNCKMARP